MTNYPKHFREKAIEALRDRLNDLSHEQYVIADYLLDDLLRKLLSICDKETGKPPYEDYLPFQVDNYYELS